MLVVVAYFYLFLIIRMLLKYMVRLVLSGELRMVKLYGFLVLVYWWVLEQK